MVALAPLLEEFELEVGANVPAPVPAFRTFFIAACFRICGPPAPCTPEAAPAPGCASPNLGERGADDIFPFPLPLPPRRGDPTLCLEESSVLLPLLGPELSWEDEAELEWEVPDPDWLLRESEPEEEAVSESLASESLFAPRLERNARLSPKDLEPEEEDRLCKSPSPPAEEDSSLSRRSRWRLPNPLPSPSSLV
jgi:hypothetical protein